MGSEETGSRQTLVIERVFAYPSERLWRALTEGPLLAQWLMETDFEPEVGRRFQFRSEPVPNWDGVIDCEVLVIEPLKRLSYRWRSLGLDSVVLWTLTAVDGGTHLRLEHSGFGADQQRAYQGASYGWQRFLGGLERVLSGGV